MNAKLSAPVLVRHEGDAPSERSTCGWRHLLISLQDRDRGVTAWAHAVDIDGAGAHFHKRSTELYYVLEGEGTVTLDGVEHSVRKGSIVHIPPGVVHSAKGQCTEMLGGTDLGVTYWAECDEQSGMHMVNMDYIITELLHPDTGEILAWEDGAKGEMIYTALGRRASPLVRFRSGDFIEVLGTTCSCGRTGPKIRCTGRTDDMLIVRGANVFPSAINSVVNEMVPETNGVMRVVAHLEGHTTQEPLKIIVERGPARKPEGDPTLKKKIELRMRDALVFKADVRIVDPDTFEKPGAAKVAFVLRKDPDLP